MGEAGEGGKITKHLPAGLKTCFPQEIQTCKSLNIWHYACPPKPMPGRRNKRLGGREGVAAVAGTVLGNQWFGLRFQSLKTLAEVEEDGKNSISARLWQLELVPGLWTHANPLDGWTS